MSSAACCSRHRGAMHRAPNERAGVDRRGRRVAEHPVCLVAAPRWGMVTSPGQRRRHALMSALGPGNQTGCSRPLNGAGWPSLQPGDRMVALDRWLQASGLPGSLLAAILLKRALLLAFPIMLFATGFFRHGGCERFVPCYRVRDSDARIHESDAELNLALRSRSEPLVGSKHPAEVFQHRTGSADSGISAKQ
jgi:hypothetical protein